MSLESTVSSSLEEEVGFRFYPTDEELVNYYLKNKRLGMDNLVWRIPEVDVCKCEPWDLPDKSVIKSNDRVWFFFCSLNLKHSNSHRSNRATESGFWKVTGKDMQIRTRGTNNVIATKKTLVFYKGRVRHGVRTDWVMHEYHPTENLPNQRSFILCRLKNKADEKTDTTTPKADEKIDATTHKADEKTNATTSDESEPNISNALEEKPNSTTFDESEPSCFNALDEKANATTSDGKPSSKQLIFFI